MSEDPTEMFLLETPAQLKAISDPFRQQLLGAFREPATAQQAAKALGVPVGRLYHHLDQLTEAGLLKVVAERRRRGAVERTFRVVAPRIGVGPGALGGADAAQTREVMARGALDEMLAGFTPATSPQLHIARTRVRLTPEALAWFEARFADLVKELETPDGIETDLLFFAAPRD